MATIAAPALTLEEFSQLPRDGQRHEITEGRLITMPPPKSLHARIGLAVLKALQAHLQKKGKADVMPEVGYILSLDPLTVRQPDVSVLSNDRISATPPDSYFQGAPELAIEVVSPSDSAEDLELKAAQYLQSGSVEVWIIYPKTKTVHVHHSGGQVRILRAIDVLDSTALPGFSMKVADLFPQ